MKRRLFLCILRTTGTTFARILRLNYFLWRKDRVYWKDYQMTKPIDQMVKRNVTNWMLFMGISLEFMNI